MNVDIPLPVVCLWSDPTQSRERQWVIQKAYGGPRTGRIQITGRDRYWSPRELRTFDHQQRHRGKKGVMIQLHPIDCLNYRRPSTSLVPLQWLFRFKAQFVTGEQEHVLRLPPHCLLHDRLRRALFPEPRNRLRRIQHILPTSASATSASVTSASVTTPMSVRAPEESIVDLTGPESDAVKTVPPVQAEADEQTPKRVDTRPMFACSVCEKESRNFNILEMEYGRHYEPDDLLILCDGVEAIIQEDKHFICGSCVVESFRHSGKLPCCSECQQNEGGDVPPLLFRQALCIFAGSDPSWHEACRVEIPMEEIPDIVTLPWMDYYINEGTLLYRLCEMYWIREQNTQQRCACHSNHPANGNVCSVNQIVDFSEYHTTYPTMCMQIQEDGSVEMRTLFRPHPTVCYECLEAHPAGATCRVSGNYINRWYRAPDKDHCIGRVFRNNEITKADIDRFIQDTMFADNLCVTCPGCHTKIHRSEACNEMECSCGYRMCFYCGYASWQKHPLLDHFSSSPHDIAAGCCPRYEHQTTALLGIDYPCSSACQSHASGDCTVPEHKPFRTALETQRKKIRIKKFIDVLCGHQKVHAIIACQRLGIDLF